MQDQDWTETFPKVVVTDLVDPASWLAVSIPPGTPYPDEPSQTQPAGWRVFGGEADPSGESGCSVELRVELAYSPEGTDMSAEVAHLVAALLREAGYNAGYPNTAPRVLHRVSWWQEVWSAATGRAPKARCGTRLSLQAGDPPVRLSSPDCPDCPPRG